MTANQFCRHLSNGYRIYINDSGISYMPCCQWTGQPLPFADLANQRKQLNIDVPWAHAECGRCKSEESYKSEGYRLIGNRVIPEHLDSSKVAWLDIQADITCNGGCLICGPWSSSFWQSELSRHGEYKIIPASKNLKSSVDEIFSKLDVSELRLLQFLGGEPFLSKTDEYAFHYITNPQVCKLKYTTNGSIYPQTTRMQKWDQFKEVLVNFSIDGIEDQFEYLRYPLQWSTVENNIKKIIAETSDRVKFHINHTVTPLNIYYYDRFINWVEEIFPANRLTGIHTHTAYGVMNVNNASHSLCDQIKKKYGVDHMLSQMIKHGGNQDNTEFWNHIDLWDQRRNTNWTQVFPDIEHFLKSN